MTWFLSFRRAPVAGLLGEAQVFECDGLADRLLVTPAGVRLPAERVSGREVVLAIHGFNVSEKEGVHGLARLEQDLHLPAQFLFVGVLWPGDWWIPVLNYPTEAGDAVRCGRRLGTWIDAALGAASGVSLLSHSLGGRVALEALLHLKRPVREVCMAAAAVDDDCLTTSQYSGVLGKAKRISLLASKKDLVLRAAYPVGDFVADVLYDADSPWRAALGVRGPRTPAGDTVLPAQIPIRPPYGHYDYWPSGDLGDVNAKVWRPEGFVAESLLGLPHDWPRQG